MSADTVKQILQRAVTEPAYRQLLLANPVQAAAGYDLTSAEQMALSSLTPETFDALAGDLEGRLSRLSLGILGQGPVGPTGPT
jgi:hypothetical protein